MSLKNPWKEFLNKCFCSLPLGDKLFNEVMYRHYFKKPLHLDQPVAFTEKIQWMKTYGSNDTYSTLVDKYAVRGYVVSKVGSGYLNELYGVFKDVSEIDFHTLPNKFVLKATHGSGWNILCPDKNQLDLEATRRQLRHWLRTNFYRISREPNYKNIPPRIICERFLAEEGNIGLLDFKFFCFHGHVKVVQVDFDRFTNHTRNMYDRNWNLYPFTFIYPNNSRHLPEPKNLREMIEVSETLAGEMPLVRVDLYNVASRILFGELTFTPESGFGRFKPEEWDYTLGVYLQLPFYEGSYNGQQIRARGRSASS